MNLVRSAARCPAGFAPWVNVRDLSEAPDSVTDWSPLILAQFAVGVRRFVFQAVGMTPTAYPFTTALDFDGTIGVTLEGPNGKIWPGDSHQYDLAPAYLLWKGTGSVAAISAVDATGFTISDLGVYYDNAGFTGTLVKLGGVGFVSNKALIENSVIRSTPASALQSARCAVSLDGAIVSTLQNNVIGWAQYGVIGAEHAFSNANRILNNVFHVPAIAAIANPGQQCTIDSNIFEMGGTTPGMPQVVADIGAGGGDFTFSNNWIGDWSVDAIPFIQNSSSAWYATFSGNHVLRNGTGLNWSLAGSGVINIVGNPNLTNGDSVQVDLVGPSPQKELVWVGNGTQATGVTEAIINRAGHRLWIKGADQASMLGVTEIERERLAYPARQPRPTIVANTALGGGGAASVVGGDTAGQVSLTAGIGGTTGTVCTVTFGTPEDPAPGSPEHKAVVMLQPYAVASGVSAGLYVSAVTGTGFSVDAVSAVVGNCYFFYRVIWM